MVVLLLVVEHDLLEIAAYAVLAAGSQITLHRLGSEDPPVLYVSDRVGALIQVGRDVRGEENGYSFSAQDVEDIQKLIAGDGIQTAGGLVVEQDVLAGAQRARNGHALLL